MFDSRTTPASAFAEIHPDVYDGGVLSYAGAAPGGGVRAEEAARLAAPPEVLGSRVARDLGRRVDDGAEAHAAEGEHAAGVADPSALHSTSRCGTTAARRGRP